MDDLRYATKHADDEGALLAILYLLPVYIYKNTVDALAVFKIEDRRKQDLAHFINDRRKQKRQPKKGAAYLVFYAIMLYTLSITLLVVSFHAPLQLSIPLMYLYTAYVFMLFIRPIRRLITKRASA